MLVELYGGTLLHTHAFKFKFKSYKHMHIYNQENRKGKGKWKNHLGSISPSPSHSACSSSPSPPLLPPPLLFPSSAWAGPPAPGLAAPCPSLSLADARVPPVSFVVHLVAASRTWHSCASTPRRLHPGASGGKRRHDATMGPHGALFSPPLPSPPSR